MTASQLSSSRLLLTVRAEIEKALCLLPLPFAAILTDENGIVLEIFCYSLLSIAASLKIGDNLSRKRSGLNGISLAMEESKLSIVQGEEHSLRQFKELNCIGTPIRCGNATLGYLDLSVPKERPVDFAAPYVQLLAQNINHCCADYFSSDPKKNPDLHRYSLTAREQEVALFWFNQKSALYIANQLGIAEGTVRNTIKKVYEKMKVSDRNQLIRKVNAKLE